jgi:cytoskeletal protein CcmA (bactofilin family)
VSVFNTQNDRMPGIPGLPERRPVPGASPSAPAAGDAARRPSVLGKTLVFKGELWADEDLVLQGKVEGAIHHRQSLTVGPDGVVVGDIRARSIVVEGTVEGDLHGTASVIVAATAKVRGNIVAPRVGIMEGANFNGSVDMSSAQGAAVEPVPQRPHDLTLSDTSVDRVLNRP